MIHPPPNPKHSRRDEENLHLLHAFPMPGTGTLLTSGEVKEAAPSDHTDHVDCDGRNRNSSALSCSVRKKCGFWLLLFLFDKHFPITEYLSSKDSSHELQINCVISFYFRLYLILDTCDQRFDVTENFENFCELNKRSRRL